MGARGPKPKDNAASKIAELTPLDIKPPHLEGGKAAEAEYRRIATELVKLGHLTDVNRQCLVNYCEAWALAAEALAEINADGITLENAENGNKYLHPACGAWSMARGIMEKEAKNLGMTPASLQSIKGVNTPKKDGPKDGPSKFLT